MSKHGAGGGGQERNSPHELSVKTGITAAKNIAQRKRKPVTLYKSLHV